ncbi:MAG TPA: hypothetical protein VNA87_03620 [Actinomycetota bacterium]|nr:hypothetical protein [Actinomycetota bacterium]
MTDQGYLLESIETISYTKDGEPKELFKAHFEGGRKAVFFSKTLLELLEKLKGQRVFVELGASKREGGDPSIEKLVDANGAVLFPKKGSGGAGGSRPMFTDDQAKWIAAGLHDIADALRSRLGAVGDPAVTGSAPLTVSEPVQPPQSSEGGGGLSGAPTPPPSDDSREEWLQQLRDVAAETFPNAPHTYERWLVTALKDFTAQATDDLTVHQIADLVGRLKTIADSRKVGAA